MVIESTDLASFVQQYFLPFVRIGSMMAVAPIFGSRVVNARVRLMLAILVTLVVVPILPPLPKVEILSLSTFVLVVHEFLLGLAVGFIFQVVFQVFVLCGQYIAMKMGLGFASMNDPTNGVQTTVVSQFFLMIATLMFVSINGHILLISLIVESFNTLPIGGAALNRGKLYEIALLGSWLFSAALVMALPVLTSLLFVNIAFGVMSRAAPQLNIFAVGFPFTLVVGLLLIWVSLSNFTEGFNNTITYGLYYLQDILGAR